MPEASTKAVTTAITLAFFAGRRSAGSKLEYDAFVALIANHVDTVIKAIWTAGYEIVPKAPVPELAPSAVKAVCQGACRALATSPVAELPGISGDEWGSIAGRIATMHLDEGQA